jgi:four helix bundle protein
MAATFKDLRVWREAMKFSVEVYKVTSAFPRHELYGLSQQLRRAAVSVPSNIAEGKGHRSDREFGHFLLHARGSLLEVQTQVMIAQELQYLEIEEAQRLLASADTIGRSLNSLINSISDKAARSMSQRPRTND